MPCPFSSGLRKLALGFVVAMLLAFLNKKNGGLISQWPKLNMIEASDNKRQISFIFDV